MSSGQISADPKTFDRHLRDAWVELTNKHFQSAEHVAVFFGVTERAAREPCRFTLLVPRPYWDPDTEEAAITLERAIPLLDAAATRAAPPLTEVSCSASIEEKLVLVCIAIRALLSVKG